MTASYLTTSESDLVSGVIAAFVADGYAYNPLSTSADEYLVGVLNGLTGQSFSHLRMSRDEVLARIASNLTGTSYSHLSTTQDELLVLVLNNIEGGGDEVPEWVPENAKIHIDLVGGSPQGRAWVDGVGIVAVDTLLGADANTENGWAVTTYDPEQLAVDGYQGTGGNDSVAFIGSALAEILAGATVRIGLKYSPGQEFNTNPFIVVSEDGNAGVFAQINSDTRDVKVASYAGDLVSIASIVNYSEDAAILNAIAFTTVPTRFDLTANGSDAETTPLTTDDYPASGDSPIVAALFDVSDVGAFYQSITLYDALPSTAGLSELSETGVVNTAPTAINITWDARAPDGELPQEDATTVPEIAVLTGDDAEGNPLAFTVVAADDAEGVGVDPGTPVVTIGSGGSASSVFLTVGGIDAGGYAFTIRATDPGELFVEQEFTITVTA